MPTDSFRMRGRFVFVGLVLSALAGGCRSRPASVPPPAWFLALREGDATRFATLPTRKLTLAGETRNAVFGGAPVVAELAVPRSGGELELAGALRCAEDELCGGGASFHVAVADGGASRELATFRLTAAWRESHPEARARTGTSARWHVERLPLADFAGRTVQLEFRVERSAIGSEGTTAQQPAAFWADPLLLAPAAQRQNVVLISLDTLRADRLGSYGYRRGSSPQLDALAAEGLRFANAFTTAPWTTPAHMSLFTGLFPSTHRVTSRAGESPARQLARGVPTLAGLLRERGYRTRAYTGGGSVGAALGFDRGFDVYEDGPLKLTSQVRDELPRVLAGLQGTPFLLFFHTFEVHAPYTRTRYVEDRLSAAARDEWACRFDLEWLPRPGERALEPNAPMQGPMGALPEAYRARRKQLAAEGIPEFMGRHGLWNRDIASALYDGGVSEADAFVGQLLSELRKLGLAERTIVVVTSDHGEEFGEHDPNRFWDAHCTPQHDELLRVPLILKAPGLVPGVRTEQVQLTDLAPTLLEQLGLRVPASMQGRSLLPRAGVAAPARPPWALAEATCAGPEIKALRHPTDKYVADFDPTAGDEGPLTPTSERLYDLQADPSERRDRARSDPERLGQRRGELRAIVERLRATSAAGETRALTPEALERLRALGYVQ